MPVVKVKPTSAGRRSLVKVTNNELHKGAPHRALLERKTVVVAATITVALRRATRAAATGSTIV